MPSKNFKAGLQTMGGGLKDNYGELPLSDNGNQNQLSARLLQKLEKAAEGLPILEIEIVKLEDNPYQHLARPDNLNSEALEQLVSSIKQRGFYGTLVARRKPNALGKYQLAYGHRRRTAALAAGLTTLPVKVVDLNDAELFEIMASENLVRDDLTPIGQANLVGHLYTANNMTLDQIGKVLHKKRGWCQLRLSLYEAPVDVKAMVTQRPDTLSYVNLIKQVSESNVRSAFITAVVSEGLSRTELQRRIQTALGITKSEVTTDDELPYLQEVFEPNEDADSMSNQKIVNISTSDTPMTASEIPHNQTNLNLEEQEIIKGGELKVNSQLPLAKVISNSMNRLTRLTTSLEQTILANVGSSDLAVINTDDLRALAERLTFLAITLSSKPISQSKNGKPRR